MFTRQRLTVSGHRLVPVAPHALQKRNHRQAVQFLSPSGAAPARHVKHRDGVIHQAHLLVGDAQVIVGVDVRGVDHLLQALLEFGKHLVDRVLEVAVGRLRDDLLLRGVGGQFLGELLGEVVGAGADGNGLNSRRPLVPRHGLRKRCPFLLHRLQLAKQGRRPGKTRTDELHRLENLPRLLDQPLLDEEGGFVQFLGDGTRLHWRLEDDFLLHNLVWRELYR